MWKLSRVHGLESSRAIGSVGDDCVVLEDKTNVALEMNGCCGIGAPRENNIATAAHATGVDRAIDRGGIVSVPVSCCAEIAHIENCGSEFWEWEIGRRAGIVRFAAQRK